MTFSILHLDGHVDDTPTFEHEDDLKAFIRSHFPDAWFGEYEHAPHAPAAFCNVFESEIACDGGMEPIGVIEWIDDDPELIRAAEQWAESVEIRVAQLPPGEYEKTDDSATTRRDNNTIRHELSNYDELCQHRFAKYAHSILRERFDERIDDAIAEANEFSEEFSDRDPSSQTEMITP